MRKVEIYGSNVIVAVRDSINKFLEANNDYINDGLICVDEIKYLASDNVLIAIIEYEVVE